MQINCLPFSKKNGVVEEVNTIKSSIANAINGKYDTPVVTNDTPLSTYAAAITGIDTGIKTQNTKDTPGYVLAGKGYANYIWATDANGNPGWRKDTAVRSFAQVQQGGGNLQGPNKVYLGWCDPASNYSTGALTTGLRLQVDWTDLGYIPTTGPNNAVLPPSWGGTGHNTINGASNAFINALSTGSDVPRDADYYVCQYANGGSTTTSYHRRPTSKIWDYILTKLNNGTSLNKPLQSSYNTASYINGNKGGALISSTATAGSYVMLDKLNSTNGYFTDGVHQSRREFHYTSKATVESGSNAVDKNLILLDESGNSRFPGNITANNVMADISNSRVTTQNTRLPNGTSISNILTIMGNLIDKHPVKLLQFIGYDNLNSGTYTEYISDPSGEYRAMLFIGIGCGWNGTDYAEDDYFLVKLILTAIGDTSKSVLHCSYKMQTLASIGATTRVNVSLVTDSSQDRLKVTIPRGSAAWCYLYGFSIAP